MVIKIIAVHLLSLFCCYAGFCQQKMTMHVQQVWLGYNNQTRFSNKWGGWADLHLRSKEKFFSNLSVSIARVGLTYYVSDAVKLTAGYAYVSFYPGDNHKGVTQPEHRPWQQVQWHTRYTRNRTMQWLRLEERYRRKIQNDSTLAEGSSFNWKLRYNFLFQVPLSKKRPSEAGTWSFIANDEVHINFGRQIVNNYFDQNRFFLGFAYHTNKSDNLQIGYLNVFQQLAAGNQYKNIHAARIFYFHNLDLRKGKSK